MTSNFSYDKSNPFFSTDDVDDATFLKGSGGGNHGRAYQNSTMEDRTKQLLEERRKIEERTVQSSFRSISLLHESEQVGAATAEELVKQREQLQNAEVKLDDINSTLQVSQRHIQGIKSVFGSIRNYFSGAKNDPSKLVASTSGTELDGKKQPEEAAAKSQLSQILETKSQQSNSSSDMHPTERFRSEGPLSSRQVDDILDRNLEDIGNSISKLKFLGLDLNKEIDDQNSMLERITTKTENVDHRINSQTKDMNRILKK